MEQQNENGKIQKREIKIEKAKKEKKVLSKQAKFNLLAIVLILILCFALTPRTLQNDTYYTIAIGKLITENGIDMKDHFSWHFNLPYTYPHWLYDLCIYLIYAIGGFNGIYISTVILCMVLGLTMYFTCTKRTKNQVMSLIVTLGAMYLLKDFITARAQLVTFTLFLLVVFCIEQFLETKKKRYGIELVILSWLIANLHCAVWPFMFVLFLPYLAEYFLCAIIDADPWIRLKKLICKIRIKILEKKKKQTEKTEKKLSELKQNLEQYDEHRIFVIERRKKRRENPYRIRMQKNSAIWWLLLIMVFCVIMGALTPIKDTPFTYLAKTMEGTTTNNISEHLPLTLANNKGMIILLSIFLAIFIFTDAKIRLSDFFMLGGLVVLTFMSRRQMSMLVLFGAAILVRLVDYLLRKYDPKGVEQLQGFLITLTGKILSIAFICVVAIALYRPIHDDKIVDDNTYPVEACDYILNNLDITTMRLYNEYNYGAYLVYRGIPVFIDSRADLYSPEFNGTKNPETKEYEGLDIFSDYINISNIATDYDEKFTQYGITHVLVYKNAKLKMLLDTNEKYTQIYEDNRFAIFERNTDKVAESEGTAEEIALPITIQQ